MLRLKKPTEKRQVVTKEIKEIYLIIQSFVIFLTMKVLPWFQIFFVMI